MGPGGQVDTGEAEQTDRSARRGNEDFICIQDGKNAQSEYFYSFN